MTLNNINLKKLLINNPELKRNAILEIGITKLILMPIIILLIQLIIFTFVKTAEVSDVLFSLIQINIYLYYAITLFWGTKQVSDSVIDEVNNKTWDNQRMTSMKPIEMAIGKLFGSSIYSWYGALILLILNLFYFFLISTVETSKLTFNNSYPFFISFNQIIDGKHTFLNAFGVTVMHLLISIFTQLIVITISILGIQKNRNKRKISSTGYYLLGLAINWCVMFPATMLSIAGSYADDNLKEIATIKWYFFEVDTIIFPNLSLIVFIIWLFYSLVQLFKSELKYQISIIPWLYFLGFLIVYVIGFIFSSFILQNSIIATIYMKIYFMFIAISMLVSSITYLIIILKPKDIMDIKILENAYKEHNYKKILEYMPLWLPNILLIFSLLLITKLLGLDNFDAEITRSNTDSPISGMFQFTGLGLNPFLELIRNILLIYYLNFSRKFKSPDLVFFIFATLINVLNTTLFYSIVGIPNFTSGNNHDYFSNLLDSNLLFILLLNIIEVLILIALVSNVYQKFSKVHNALNQSEN